MANEWDGYVRSEADVRTWFRELLDDGINFHPDTRGEDYDPPLSADDAFAYERRMEDAFGVAESDGFDVYEVAVNVRLEWAKAFIAEVLE